MRHGYTTMEQIRDNMEHQLDAETMMHLTGYGGGGTYSQAVVQDLIALVEEIPDAYCKETILWAFDYADRTWSVGSGLLNELIDAWMNTEEEE